MAFLLTHDPAAKGLQTKASWAQTPTSTHSSRAEPDRDELSALTIIVCQGEPRDDLPEFAYCYECDKSFAGKRRYHCHK